MRILFLTQLFPYPPVCGGTIKSFNILKHLGERHEVTVAAFVRKDPSQDELKAVRQYCAKVFTVPIKRSTVANIKFAAASLVGSGSFIVSRDWVPEMRELVARMERSGKFDLLYVDHLQMAQYVLDWKSCPKLLDEHNVEWKIIERIAGTDESFAKRLFASREWRKLKRWELKACEKFDAVLTVTEKDCETLMQENRNLRNVNALPIGVDFDNFSKTELQRDAVDILSIGTMSWPPNEDAVLHFAENIYPMVKQSLPNARFVVAGKGPSEKVRQLAVEDHSIKVLGFVDDIESIVSEAMVFAVPLRSGSGMRVKILNAMAMGLPVVTTSIGCEGIGARDGDHLVVADNPADFAAAIVRLANNFGFRKQIAEAGRQFVEDNYSWKSILPRLDEVVETTLGFRTTDKHR